MMNTATRTLGKFSIREILFGSFRLDGGCMFGSVPKNLWSRSIPADEENCIPLVCRSLLIEDSSRKILIDVGCGDKWNEKARAIYQINNTPSDALGLHPMEITDVILTHLHFDHAGGISYRRADGQLALTYPNATVHLQTANWDHARNPSPKDKASYLAENIEPLKNARLQLHNGSAEIIPGITTHRVDGHTPGQQWIEISQDGQSIFFPTDLVPTSHHVPLPYHMGYDVCAETLLREKLSFLDRASRPGVHVCFQHDRDVPWATITKSDTGHFSARASVLEQAKSVLT